MNRRDRRRKGWSPDAARDRDRRSPARTRPNDERLSRFLSLLLRHKPAAFGLRVDHNGFADVTELLGVLSERFQGVTRQDLERVVATGERPRFEIQNDRIRATYGHSLPIDLGLEPVVPPPVLYHGTARYAAEKICREGLRPHGRQFVHLSTTADTAQALGTRHDPRPVVLRIAAAAAAGQGIRFYCSGNLYLTTEVPPEFITPLTPLLEGPP